MTLDLKDDPALVERIQKDIAGLGVVGEENNSLLAYLIFTSRLLNDPGAIITRGQSSIGKSHIIYKAAELMPPESRIEAMSMTPASLFNTPEDFLKNKILICGERKHSTDDVVRDQNAVIRQLLSEKKISRSVSVPGGSDGRWVTELVVREGPVAYAESTTAGSIFDEDLNRLLQLYPDDSYEQTRNIMVAKASRYDPEKAAVNHAEIIERHHEFQRSLSSYDVRIPYWKQLADAMPARKVESRRVIQQVLTVIESIVILHQYQREQKDGCLLATIEDYALARKLLLSPVHSSLGVGKDYKKAERLRAVLKQQVFTSKDVADALKFKSKMGASHLLSSLVKSELVVCVCKASGKTAAKYEWSPDKEWDVLPDERKLLKRQVTGNGK